VERTKNWAVSVLLTRSRAMLDSVGVREAPVVPCAGASEVMGCGAFVVRLTASIRRTDATAAARE
jgi:hypothetical protein